MPKIAAPDTKRVNANEALEVRYWCDKWGVTENELRAAVRAVGVMVKAVASPHSATPDSCPPTGAHQTVVGKGRRVAVVEDDPCHAELFGHWLASAGFTCSPFAHGQSALRALTQERFDAVVLDWMLPDLSGLDVLKQMRGALQSSVPVLLVSARDSEGDIVTALSRGADDYMVKPLRRMELLARLDALCRRSGKATPAWPAVIDLGPLHLDCQTRTARRDESSVHLTGKNFDLAVLFSLNIGRLLSRGEIRDAVWGPGAVASSRTIDTHISRVRDQLGLTPSNGWRLAAVYGHGYRLQRLAHP